MIRKPEEAEELADNDDDDDRRLNNNCQFIMVIDNLFDNFLWPHFICIIINCDYTFRS